MKKYFSVRLLLLLPSLLGSVISFFFLSSVPSIPALKLICQVLCGFSLFLKAVFLLYLLISGKKGIFSPIPAALLTLGTFLPDLVLCLFLFFLTDGSFLPYAFLILSLLDLLQLGHLLWKALRQPRTSLAPFLYTGLIFLLILVFTGCFALGLMDWDSSSESSPLITGFTAEDERLILQDIQKNFSETVYYQTSNESELIENEEGVCYYNITYLVCVPSSDEVYVYLYYKFVTDSEDYQAGDVVCLMNSVSPSLTKSDLFPDGLH